MEETDLGKSVREAIERRDLFTQSQNMQKGTGFEEITIAGPQLNITLRASREELIAERASSSKSEEASMVWLIRQNIRKAIVERYEHTW
jgi:hypothetical protein